jgi:hypothetical protein
LHRWHIPVLIRLMKTSAFFFALALHAQTLVCPPPVPTTDRDLGQPPVWILGNSSLCPGDGAATFIYDVTPVVTNPPAPEVPEPSTFFLALVPLLYCFVRIRAARSRHGRSNSRVRKA